MDIDRKDDRRFDRRWLFVVPVLICFAITIINPVDADTKKLDKFLYSISDRAALCELLNGTCVAPWDCAVYVHSYNRYHFFACNVTTICCYERRHHHGYLDYEHSSKRKDHHSSDKKKGDPVKKIIYSVTDRVALCDLLNGTCVAPHDCAVFVHSYNKKQIKFDCNLTAVCCFFSYGHHGSGHQSTHGYGRSFGLGLGFGGGGHGGGGYGGGGYGKRSGSSYGRHGGGYDDHHGGYDNDDHYDGGYDDHGGGYDDHGDGYDDHHDGYDDDYDDHHRSSGYSHKPKRRRGYQNDHDRGGYHDDDDYHDDGYGHHDDKHRGGYDDYDDDDGYDKKRSSRRSYKPKKQKKTYRSRYRSRGRQRYGRSSSNVYHDEDDNHDKHYKQGYDTGHHGLGYGHFPLLSTTNLTEACINSGGVCTEPTQCATSSKHNYKRVLCNITAICCLPDPHPIAHGGYGKHHDSGGYGDHSNVKLSIHGHGGGLGTYGALGLDLLHINNRTELCALKNGTCLNPEICITSSHHDGSYGGGSHHELDTHKSGYNSHKQFYCNLTAVCCFPERFEVFTYKKVIQVPLRRYPSGRTRSYRRGRGRD